MRITAAVLMAAIMIISSAVPVFAQQGSEIRVTDFEQIADHQVVAVDSMGNVHIAYCVDVGLGALSMSEESAEMRDFSSAWDSERGPQDVGNGEPSIGLWYTMLDNNGNTLIDDTLISVVLDFAESDIAVDSEDKVHIVWCNGEYAELFYTKLDPYLDDRDGDSAEEAVITMGKHLKLTYLEARIPQIAVDSNNNIHAIFYSYYQGLCYMQMDNAGNVTIDPIVLGYVSTDHYSIAVDSNNDAHIAWNSLGSSYEIYYQMLDGSNGSTLVDATMVTADDGYNSKRPSVTVDSQDMVNIIWHDKRGLDTEIYYTKLDPGLDDQNGDAADESIITVIDDKALTPNDGVKSNNPSSAMGCSYYIHITWDEEHEGEGGPAYIHYMVVDCYGNSVVADTALITEKTHIRWSPWSVINLDVDSDGKAHIVWADFRDGGWSFWEVYYTNYEGPPCLWSEFTATPIIGATPLEVQFTDESGCDPTSWSWDFGDGGTSNEQNPVHVYNYPGPFTVSLTASGGSCQNGTATRVDYIHPYTIGVGGEVYPIAKLALYAPWVALLIAIPAAYLLISRRYKILK